MKDLKEIKEKDKISGTEQTKRIHIGGVIKDLPVWKISIKELFYNDQNDRIASQISEYVDKNKLEKFEIDLDNIDEYNNIVAEFIKDSNLPAFEKTKNNIKKLGQLEAGVVLRDGRIIDGNRRFTCLRDLYYNEKLESFGYFNAVILDGEEYSQKAIKMLELELQHGHEDKVGYDIYNRCAGIYRDLIKEKHLFTIEEYASITDERVSDVEKLVEKTKLFMEFLEYANAPGKFHIARELEIDGPISELISQKKIQSSDSWNKLKIICFDNIMLKTEKDITRFIRDIKKYVKAEELNKYYEEHKEVSKKVNTELENMKNVTSEDIKAKIRSNDIVKAESKKIFSKYTDKGKIRAEKEQPIKLLERVVTILDEVDIESVIKMGQEDKDRFSNNLNEVISKIKNIEGKLK